MLSMKKISIIIPAYNVEQYIDKCLKSISNQTYQNWEAIIVIDGATDDTEKLAREWEKRDPRFLVEVQENRGSGIARNKGMSKATGNYMMFIDPDDWIESEMLEDYEKRMTDSGADLLISGSTSDFYDRGRLISSEYDVINERFLCGTKNIREQYLNLFSQGLIRGPVTKMYKSQIIKKNRILFPDLYRSQDIVFNYRYFDKIESIQLFQSAYYHYRQGLVSQNKKIKTDYYKTISRIYKEVCTLHRKWGIMPDENDFESFCCYLYNALLVQVLIGNSSQEMKNIVSDAGLKMLVKKVKPETLKKKFLKILILMGMYRSINLCIALYRKMNGPVR